MNNLCVSSGLTQPRNGLILPRILQLCVYYYEAAVRNIMNIKYLVML